MRKILSTVLLLSLFFISRWALAETETAFPHPLYFGVTGGYGSTTWDGLMPAKNNQNAAMTLSTPTRVNEGGGTWGIFLGYELIPFFALEGAYQRFPTAKLSFDEMSLFTFQNDGVTELSTQTETVSVMAKLMLLIPKTKIRAYSSVGAAEIHREDSINDEWILSPTFAAGFNYNITEHWMAEIGANYTTGNGESELNPVNDYIPFLYSVYMRLAYRI